MPLRRSTRTQTADAPDDVEIDERSAHGEDRVVTIEYSTLSGG
jgi:hypothetical protein